MPDVVSLPGIATQLGAALGIGSFGGQVLMGLIFMMICLMPTLYLCNRRGMNVTYPALIVGISSLVGSVIMFGFPAWIILIIGLIAAFMFAGTVRDTVTGRGGGN